MKKHQIDYENEQYGAEIKRRLSSLDEHVSPPLSLAPAAIRERLQSVPSRRTEKRRAPWGALALMTAVMLLCMLPGTVWRDIGSLRERNEGSNVNQAAMVAADYGDVINVARVIQQNASRYSYRDGFTPENGVNEFADDAGIAMGGATEESARATAPTTTAGGSDYTGTNVQVEGVDEADIVKTDGSYIYAVNHNRDAVLIVSVSPDGAMSLVSTIELDEYSLHEFYVSGDRLIVIAQDAPPSVTYREEISAAQPYDGGVLYDTPDYRNDDSYTYGAGGTKLSIYDIADRAHPKQMRAYSQDGAYLSSRLVDGRVYLITNHSVYATAADGSYDLDRPEALVPNTSDSACGDSVSPIAARDIVIAGQPSAMSYVVVSALGTERADAPAAQKSVLGSGSAVYANSERLYVASASYAEDTPSTQVMRFDLTDGLSYQTSGQVPGTILNQFSMDEWKGHLRIATTKQDWDVKIDEKVAVSQRGGATTNNLYILDADLKITGRVENLAPGESIYAVRFMEKTAYIVTFRQVDPLFAIDVTDPAAPKVLGQLKIPGFSSYLHPFSDTLLIGIGQQADPETGRTEGLKLSFFDVSDPTNLRETHQYQFGSEFAYADALNNHKAVMVSRGKGLLGFFVDDYGSKSNAESAFYLFRADEKSGFTLLGSIRNPDAGGEEGFSQSSRRGLLIGDTLFTVSGEWIVATSLEGFTEAGRLRLPV